MIKYLVVEYCHFPSEYDKFLFFALCDIQQLLFSIGMVAFVILKVRDIIICCYFSLYIITQKE